MKSVFTTEYECLLKHLIEARKTKGITQITLANRLGRPQSFVSKYEHGERRLDVIEFVAVAKAIGLSPTQIIAQIEDTSTPSINSGGCK